MASSCSPECVKDEDIIHYVSHLSAFHNIYHPEQFAAVLLLTTRA